MRSRQTSEVYPRFFPGLAKMVASGRGWSMIR